MTYCSSETHAVLYTTEASQSQKPRSHQIQQIKHNMMVASPSQVKGECLEMYSAYLKNTASKWDVCIQCNAIY